MQVPIPYIYFQVIETDTIFTEASGLQQILTVSREVVSNRNNLEQWATKFSPNFTSFKEALKDFEMSNVENYLKSVFRLRCSDSMDSMYKAFRCYTYFDILLYIELRKLKPNSFYSLIFYYYHCVHSNAIVI